MISCVLKFIKKPNNLGFFVLLFVLFVNISIIHSQNLIYNGDFELYSTLPNDLGDCMKAVGWSNSNGIPYAGSDWGTPDYLHWNGFGYGKLPFNTSDSVYPYSGRAIMGLCFWGNFDEKFREYISTRLTQKMQVGSVYKLEMYITFGLYCNFDVYQTKNFGMLFSKSQPKQQGYKVINLIPQIQANTFIGSHKWTKLSFSFRADSAYEFLTIGNFYDKAHTAVVFYDSGYMKSNAASSYYYIDKISLFPKVLLSGDTVLCKGETTTLKAFYGSAYKWSLASTPTVIIDTGATIKLQPKQTTTYLCTSTYDETYVTIYVTDPSVSIGNDTTLCDGQPVHLDASLNGATYLWSDGSTSPTLTVTKEGFYTVTTTLNGCTASDEINIDYKPDPPDIQDQYVCFNQTYSAIFNIKPQMGYHYWWYNTPTDSIILQTGTDYQMDSIYKDSVVYIYSTSPEGCISLSRYPVYAHIGIIPQADFEVSTESAIIKQPIIFIDKSIDAAYWLWDIDLSGVSLNESQFTYSYRDTGYYTIQLRILSSSGCIDSIIKPDLIHIINKIKVYVADAFTPNGDGVNDVLNVQGPVETMTFAIYNQWGMEVYRSSTLGEGWDGTYQGRQQASGNYLWLLDVVTRDGVRDKLQGVVSLIR